jgi:hypothetical protein
MTTPVKYLFVSYMGNDGSVTHYANSLVKVSGVLNTTKISKLLDKQRGFPIIILGWQYLTEEEYNASNGNGEPENSHEETTQKEEVSLP